MGAELFHEGGRTDGRADMTMLIVAFRKFANAPKKSSNSTQNISILKTVPTIRSIYNDLKKLYIAHFWKRFTDNNAL
jgi:hypothetical protein